MNYHDITFDDMLNGEGMRVVLWVSGCSHHCQGCHNPQTWDASSGIPYTPWEEAELFEKLSHKHIRGITFSGGDPLHPHNRDMVGKIAAKVKQLGKTVWLYTGYTLSFDNSRNCFLFTDEEAGLEPLQLPYLSSIDVLVDGRFSEEIRKNDIYHALHVPFRGSSNQRIIDIQKSIQTKSVILWKDQFAKGED